MYELLKSSDFVTLHCDLNPTSYHLQPLMASAPDREWTELNRVLTHGRKQDHVPMRAGSLPSRINVGVFLCKDVNELRLKTLVENLLANDRVSRVLIRSHPKNLWVHIDSWIASREDARLCRSCGPTSLDDMQDLHVVFGGNSSVLIDAVTAGVPSGYVDDLDHGSSDLHGFVVAGLIYRSKIDPDLDQMLHFYQRPGWDKTLRRFANIDDDESAVLAETMRAIADMHRKNSRAKAQSAT